MSTGFLQVFLSFFSGFFIAFAIKNRQRPTFPGSFPPSIIGAKELNFCVRDGNRCDLLAIVTGFFFNLFKKLNKIFLTYYPSYSHTLKHMTMHTTKKTFWSSARPISIGQLSALLHLHLRPIYVVVSHGSYLSEEILSCGGLRT